MRPLAPPSRQPPLVLWLVPPSSLSRSSGR
jgi:hypothetical protein